MSDAAIQLQMAVVAALRADPGLADALSGVYDGPPPRAAFPYVVIGDGLVTDWSTKTEAGREIRLPLTLWDDGEEPARLHGLTADVQRVVAALPRNLPGWRVASLVFIRSLVARDPAGPWAELVEYRARLLAQ